MTPSLLTSPVLEKLRVPHAFSTRVGGVSAAPFNSLNFGNPSDLPPEQRDPASNIRANFALVARQLHAPDRAIVEVHQIHSGLVHVVRAGSPAHPTASDTKADALVTDDPSRLIAIRVADCTPVLLASADGRVVAAVHAGWRGVIARVLPSAIDAMLTLGAHDIHAVIGPCIGARNFQVGPEVAQEFHTAFGASTPHVTPDPAHAGKSLVDLQGALREQLDAAQVRHIDVLKLCTVERSDLFFSHRRDQGKTGRMIGIIGPRPLVGASCTRPKRL